MTDERTIEELRAALIDLLVLMNRTPDPRLVASYENIVSIYRGQGRIEEAEREERIIAAMRLVMTDDAKP